MRRPTIPALTAVVAALLTACGSGTPAPTARATPAPTPTPSPSPTPPDTGTVELVVVGLGAYLETAVPAAIVRNTSTFRTAAVHVEFTVKRRSGAVLGTTSTDIAAVPPGATAATAARMDLSAGGDVAAATVTVTSWSAAATPAVTVSATAPCRGCPARPGTGTVEAAVSGPAGGAPPPVVDVAATCLDRAGSVVGGGTATATPGAGGAVSVPVITDAVPDHCALWAQPAF